LHACRSTLEDPQVDLSRLKNIGDGIYVRDLALSDKIRILEDADELIVVATSAEAEEEAEVAAEMAEPEVIERGKKEEEEEE
jgi:hypothetical protein